VVNRPTKPLLVCRSAHSVYLVDAYNLHSSILVLSMLSGYRYSEKSSFFLKHTYRAISDRSARPRSAKLLRITGLEQLEISSVFVARKRKSCGDFLNRELTFGSSRWNKVLGISLLLACRFWERRYSSNDCTGHKNDGYNAPNDTPALGGSTISLGKNTSIG
jgi:hypothetical protein